MCGICGILSDSDNLGDRESNIVASMINRLRHRGPDSEGIHKSRYGILGHARLSIIDKQGGYQPMSDPTGKYILVFNGEIYNYLELRQELANQNVDLRTLSDTEVLLQLLILYGEKALGKLNGMFAFLFLNTHTGEWLMARDHFGIKPLYYSIMNNGQLIFASEIKALFIHPDAVANVDFSSLAQYFSFQFCLGRKTLFSGIEKVEPGCYIKGVRGDVRESTSYWHVDFDVDESHTEHYFVNELQMLLADSVRMQVRSDVPLGAYLSGGIDSSTISCLMSDVVDGKFPVFTGKFLEGPAYDESRYAKIVAEKIGADLHEIIPTESDFVNDMPKIIWALDEPLAGPGIFPQYIVSKYASKYVKVVLGGQGGDEIFGGYARYLVGYLEQALKGAIYETREEGKHLVGLDSIIPNLPLLKEYVPLMKNFWSYGLFEDMDARYFHLINRAPDLSKMLTPDMMLSVNRANVFGEFQEVFNKTETRSYINKMTYFDFRTLLPALLHIEDRVSMASSLESRVPILDRRVIELVARVPPTMKFMGGKAKSLLKNAVKHLLPKEVVSRKDKMGFPVPLGEWMKREKVKEFVDDTLLSQVSLERGIYEPSTLRSISKTQGVGSRQLWGALSLELWFQLYIDSKQYR